MASAVMDEKYPLAGASGGVYSLVAAHLASIVLNWDDDRVILLQRFRKTTRKPKAEFHGNLMRYTRLFGIFTFAIVDTAYAILNRKSKNISFIAHFTGALAGFFVGIIVLKNRCVKPWEKKLKIFCILFFALFLIILLIWNLVRNETNENIDEIKFLDKLDCKTNSSPF